MKRMVRTLEGAPQSQGRRGRPQGLRCAQDALGPSEGF